MQVTLIARSAGGVGQDLYVHLPADEFYDLDGRLLVDEARALRERLGDTAATLEIHVANELGVKVDPHDHPWLEQAFARARAAFEGKPDAESAGR
jgi:hypothetical protein